ncbi:FAD binding domain-containing protein [Silicimonas sp. MF1-12-2]|uniref:FAD binding domain-containing protein n=1 Tax=Silicimonas sp. MF1-12-2 TaxID=3384793 RepID=UPI0039B36C07
MKASRFSYARPETLDEALALMADDAAEPMALAGGQSLMPMMNFRVARPGVLVDLNRVPGLSGIEEIGGTVRIGAMTRYRDLAASDVVATRLPLVAAALPHIAHAAIRNRGTIGGSMALADPAAELPAVALALGATLHLVSKAGHRDVAADDYFLGAYDTALDTGELVAGVSFPAAGPADRFGFNEIVRRHGDYAMAGAVVAAAGGAVRVAFFAVGDGAMRCPGAEEALGADLSGIDAAVAALSDLAVSGDLNGDEATKRHLAGVALRRAVAEALA